ncbi:MAG: DNA repair protein RecN [Clostridia bacterium]|nr:DNA repair protein RecN [Clostridia bacterium]
MLLSLHIKNIALISELSLEFCQGLNILSGETGAGKSIIIDSLNFVLGDRADKSLIRHGETSATVQAVFTASDNNELSELLSENGIAEEEHIIVRRTMSENGRSECRINGTIINLSALKKIVSLLVDIHSQHENQALLNENNHIKILDKYSKNLPKIKEEYRKSYFTYLQTAKELKALPSRQECERKIDILEFQIAEIEKADIKDGEEEALIKERTKCYHSQKLINGLGATIALLEGDFGATPSIHNALKELYSLTQYDDAYAKLSDRLDSVKIELTDIIFTLKEELNDSSFDSSNMEGIEKRIEEIRKIKRRFGSTVEEIYAFRKKAETELKTLRNTAEKEEKLKLTVEKEKTKAMKLAKTLHDIRVKDATTLEQSIVANLSELGMQDSVFKADIVCPADEEEFEGYLNENGADEVKFLISPNKGEPLKPLAKIASGGEMSRFMLGLKNITAELENIDTLVFDEIDTGISGRIAKVVACKLYNIARTRQVLAVTHLPQLASMADTHYLISKKVIGEKTLTFVEALKENASIREIMRLAGSLEKSESGLENAKEMKEWAENYKSGTSI